MNGRKVKNSENNNFKKGLFAADVDGTLITDQGDITRGVYKSVEKLSLNGWEFVIASGRTYYAAKSIIERFPFLNYAVLSNGAVILDVRKMEMIHIEKIYPETARTIITKGREFGVIPAVYNSSQVDQKIFFDTMEGANDYFKWFFSNDKRCVLVDDVMNYSDDVLQIGMIGEMETIHKLAESLSYVSAKIVTMPFESPSFGGKRMDYWFFHAVGENATKHNALVKMADHIGVSRNRIVAVGDNYNDSEMIENASVGVAMGNAPDVIKKIARIVVASNNDSGVSEAAEEAVFSGKYFS